MKITMGQVDELERLRTIEREYRVTVLALAVVVERLLTLTGGDSIEIADATLMGAADLRAWRNARRSSVEISIKRSD